MKNYVIAWVSGFLVALVFAERWRRMGSSSAPAVVSAPEPSEAPPPGIATRARTVASTTSRSIAVGAKADLARLRELPAKVRPGHHTHETDGAGDEQGASPADSPVQTSPLPAGA